MPGDPGLNVVGREPRFAGQTIGGKPTAQPLLLVISPRQVPLVRPPVRPHMIAQFAISNVDGQSRFGKAAPLASSEPQGIFSRAVRQPKRCRVDGDEVWRAIEDADGASCHFEGSQAGETEPVAERQNIA